MTDFVSIVHSQFKGGREPVFVDGHLNLDMKVKDFFDILASLPKGEVVSLGQLFRRDVVPGVASGALEHVLDDYRLDDGDKRLLSQILAESGSKSADELHRKLLGSVDAMSAIESFVQEVVTREVGESSLKSLFYKRSRENGFLTYGTWAWSSWGEEDKVTELETERGRVTLTTSEYYVEDSEVQAHEWKAELHSSGEESKFLAAAVGMVYKLPRSNGEATVGLGEVLDASDSVADTDILQMSAFINQHADAEDLVRRSNLCFIWIWERSKVSERGDGTLCMVQALASLKARFGPLTTVVVNIVAEQMLPCGPFGEPAAIAAARVDALDKLDSVSRSMGAMAGVEVRGIVNRHEWDQNQDRLALLALVDPGLVR